MTSSPSAEPDPAPSTAPRAAAWPGLAAGGLILAAGLAIAAFGTASDLAEPTAEAADGEPATLEPPAELVLPAAGPSAPPTAPVGANEPPTAPAGDAMVTEPAAAEDTGAAEAAPAESEAPAAAPEPPAPAVTIRYGRHPTFERFVFDWPEAAAVTVTRANGEAVVRFARAARFALDPAVPEARLTLLDPSTVRIATGAVRVRTFSLTDHRVVVDLYDAVPEAGEPEPVAGSEAQVRRPDGGLPPTGAVPSVNGAAAALPADAAPDADSLVPLGLLQSELYRRDLMIASLLARLEAVERGGPGSRGAALPPPPSLFDGRVEVTAANGAANGAAEGVEPAAGTTRPVDPDEVERALERTLTRAGALLLPPGQAEIEPGLSYTRRKTSSPVFVSAGDAGVVFIGEDTVERDEVRASLDLKVGLPFDSQIELSLPFNYVDQSAKTMVGGSVGAAADGSGQAIGNPRIGLAKTLAREGGWWPDIVARGYWDTDLGQSTDNDVVLTGNFNEVGASISAVKRQDPLAFVGGVGYSTVFEKNGIEPGDTVSFTAAAVLAASPSTSLRLGFTQQFSGEVEVDGDKIDGSDSTSGVLTIGASAVLGRRALIDVALDVGLNDDAPDYAVRLAVPIRFDLPLPRPGGRLP